MFPQIQPGDHIANRYEVLSPLGDGGFSRVFKGVQLGMKRPVAIKILSPRLDNIPEAQREAALDDFTRRFEQEAQVLSRLRDPSTVTVHDFGVHHGMPYMILELVEGTSLDRLDRSELPMSQVRVVKILRQILQSLREAHYHAILHRDIKPSNIMLFKHMGEPDRVKVLDFGMAKIHHDRPASAADDSTAELNILVGTPRYMAPELIREPSTASPATDIYSLGLVCYELLTGERVFNKLQDSVQLIGAQLDEQSLSLPATLPILDPLFDLVNRMLEKDMARRYDSIDAILQELDARVTPVFSNLGSEDSLSHDDDSSAPHMAESVSHTESAEPPVEQAPRTMEIDEEDVMSSLLDLSSAPKPSFGKKKLEIKLPGNKEKSPLSFIEPPAAPGAEPSPRAILPSGPSSPSAASEANDQDAEEPDEFDVALARLAAAQEVEPELSEVSEILLSSEVVITRQEEEEFVQTSHTVPITHEVQAALAQRSQVPEQAHKSPVKASLPGRPISLPGSALKAPPKHNVARPLRPETVSEPLDVERFRPRKKLDSAHNVAAPIDPLPLSWDDNEVTPPPPMPDREERIIVLDSPSGRHPTSAPQRQETVTTPSPAPSVATSWEVDESGEGLLETDTSWMERQRRKRYIGVGGVVLVLIALFVLMLYLVK